MSSTSTGSTPTNPKALTLLVGAFAFSDQEEEAMTTAGYEAEPHDTAALLDSLCGDLVAEPDPLIRYAALTAEQVRYDALVSAIKAERGRALAELKASGLSWQKVAEAAQLGTYQRAQQLAACAP